MDKGPHLNKSFLKKKWGESSISVQTNYVVYTVYPLISNTLDFKKMSIKAKYILNPTFSGLRQS